MDTLRQMHEEYRERELDRYYDLKCCYSTAKTSFENERVRFSFIKLGLYATPQIGIYKSAIIIVLMND